MELKLPLQFSPLHWIGKFGEMFCNYQLVFFKIINSDILKLSIRCNFKISVLSFISPTKCTISIIHKYYRAISV